VDLKYINQRFNIGISPPMEAFPAERDTAMHSAWRGECKLLPFAFHEVKNAEFLKFILLQTTPSYTPPCSFYELFLIKIL